MATTVGSIIVSIGADTSDLVKGVGRAQSSLAKVGAAAVNIGKIIASALVAATAAIAAMAIKGVQLGNELARSARIVGITAAELGGLHHAAALSEVSTQQLDKGLQRLGRTVSDADSGLKSAVNTLRELGLDANELEKLPLSEQFLRVTDAMKGMTSQGDKLRIATQLFGKSGAELIPLLDESSASIRAMMDESRRLGLQLDQNQSRVVQEASDGLDTMKGAVTGLSMQLGATFGPAIEAAAKAMANLLGWVTRSLPKLAALAERFLGITRAAQDLSDVDLSVTLIEQIKHLDAVNNRVAEMQQLQRMSPGPGNVAAVNEALKAQAEIQARINELLAERVKRKKESEKPIEPMGGGGEDDDGDLEEAKKAAAAELELVTAVAAERERVGELEIEQEREWKQILFEEAEAFHEQELQQLLDWSTVMAAERDRVAQEEIVGFEAKENEITRIAREAAEARAAFEKMTSDEKAKHLIGGMIKVTEGLAQHSKKAFQINKTAALAEATISMAQGIAAGVKLGWPLGIPAVAWAIANGAAQISAIKRTTFQGGGGGTTPSAAGSPTVNGNPVPSAAGGGSQAKSSTLRLEGINADSLFNGRQIRGLLERVQEAMKDGGKLVIA